MLLPAKIESQISLTVLPSDMDSNDTQFYNRPLRYMGNAKISTLNMKMPGYIMVSKQSSIYTHLYVNTSTKTLTTPPVPARLFFVTVCI